MRLALAAVLSLGLGGAAVAQPEPVRPEVQISLAVGQSTTLRFPNSVAEINVITEGVARATVQTDRIVTLLGLAPGSTMILVLGADKAQVFTASVTVTPDPGHSVKIYGSRGSRDPGRATDYVEFYCDATSCGRADRDMPAGRTISRTITERLPDGTLYSTTTGQ